jgi:predicted enzyme related to lactoylglutathione lyase
MPQHLAHITVLIHDYDEAIAFYADKLGFELLEDRDMPALKKRWVVVGPAGSRGVSLVLARADTPEQRALVGKQAGERVLWFLQTDDCARDVARYSAAGVRFIEPLTKKPHGTVAIFEDCAGNAWDLIEYVPGHRFKAEP